ncbi:MAG: DUF1289 domain-containing protein [Sphingomonadales bacterium]|nr:MAG: DUF1289 domain-containing protein [Sphingomonadales bacterium]
MIAGAAIESPCVSLCTMDDATGWCLGCGRTIDEIIRWGSTDDEDRRAVTAMLAARMAQLPPA